MSDEAPMRPPHEIEVLDDGHLGHWEDVVGAAMMPAFIEDLRQEFEANYAKQSPEIENACRSRNTKHLIQRAHHIKGSLCSLGLSRAAAFAHQAEVELRTDQFDRFEGFPAHLHEHIKEGLAALKERYR